MGKLRVEDGLGLSEIQRKFHAGRGTESQPLHGEDVWSCGHLSLYWCFVVAVVLCVFFVLFWVFFSVCFGLEQVDARGPMPSHPTVGWPFPGPHCRGGGEGAKGQGALLREVSEGSPCPRHLPPKYPCDLAILTSQNNSFLPMLTAERDKKRIEVSICPAGMEVIKLTPQSLRYLMSFVKHRFSKRHNRICEVLPLAGAVERKKNILAFIMEPHKPQLDTYSRR